MRDDSAGAFVREGSLVRGAPPVRVVAQPSPGRSAASAGFGVLFVRGDTKAPTTEAQALRSQLRSLMSICGSRLAAAATRSINAAKICCCCDVQAQHARVWQLQQQLQPFVLVCYMPLAAIYDVRRLAIEPRAS